MNCDRFEGLLVDFMMDEIDPYEKDLVNKHLTACPNCAKRLGEYLKIRRVFNDETIPQPSPHVLAMLSKRARQELAKDNTPFWKRWFYSPIFVPVLSSALAISLWVYYGEKGINYSPDETIYSRVSAAKRAPSAQEPNPPVSENRVLDKIELENPIVLQKQLEGGSRLQASGEKILEGRKSKPSSISSGKPSSVASKVSGKKVGIREESGGFLEAVAPLEEIFNEKDTEKADKTTEELASANLNAESMNAQALIPPTKTEEESLESGVLAEGQLGKHGEQEIRGNMKEVNEAELSLYQEIAHDELLNLALKQQKDGNCEASIKTNEGLLRTSPPPSDIVKGKAYLSLAECYERKGDLENAILNYQNLEEVSRKQAKLVKDKIEALREKMSYLKLRK
jgi:tetratricopeptide (TPR) repeat protein